MLSGYYSIAGSVPERWRGVPRLPGSQEPGLESARSRTGVTLESGKSGDPTTRSGIRPGRHFRHDGNAPSISATSLEEVPKQRKTHMKRGEGRKLFLFSTSGHSCKVIVGALYFSFQNAAYTLQEGGPWRLKPHQETLPLSPNGAG